VSVDNTAGLERFGSVTIQQSTAIFMLNRRKGIRKHIVEEGSLISLSMCLNLIFLNSLK
jgi:hypothetical protein